jgi:hypothetical protein
MLNWNYVVWGIVIIIVSIFISSIDINIYSDDNTKEISDNFANMVKDIEKVLAHHDPTARSKEYLKRCLVLIKEK